MLIKSNTKLLDVGKQLNLVIFEYFFGQFLPKTFTLYIKNTYFAKKIDSDTISWPEEGTEPGRVATAYSADKYKDPNEPNKSAE